MSRSCVFLLLNVTVLLLILSTALATLPANRRPPPRFRCFRSFDAISSFRPGVASKQDNCLMGNWFRVRNATVGVECEREGSNLNCYANLSSTVELLEREVGQAENEARGLGHLRGGRRLAYRVELRAINDSKVAYKGFDQIGFDFCNDFLSEEDCRRWKQGTVPKVDVCAAEDSIPGASNTPSICDRTYLRGSLRKPLHRNKVGAWEAIWEFWEVQQAMATETTEGEAAAATPDTVVAVSRDAVMEGDVDAVRRVGRITISFTVSEEEHFATAKNIVLPGGDEEEVRRGDVAQDSSSSSSLPAAVDSTMVMSVAVVTAGGNHTHVAEASTGDVAPQSEENEQSAEL